MNTKIIFAERFQSLMETGGHILASLVDDNGELQGVEVYGSELLGTELVAYVSTEVNPEFFAGLKPQRKVACVICSPFSMESYQVKGTLIEVSPLENEDEEKSRYWRENYLLCLQTIGVPAGALEMVRYWPDHRFRLRIDQYFAQTPQKGTGEKL